MTTAKEREKFEKLPRWNGSCGGYSLPYPEDVELWNMREDPSDGTIYYETHDTQPQIMIWCTGSLLRQHLQRLDKICPKK